MSENNLKHWQDKIKDKRKNTDFRDFLMEIASFRTITFYKNNNYISIFPSTNKRSGKIVSLTEYNEAFGEDTSGIQYDESISFFKNFGRLLSSSLTGPNVVYGDCENTEYSDQTKNSSHVYLSFVVVQDCENIAYSFSIKENCSNVYNSLMVWNDCNNIFTSLCILESYNIYYSKYINNSNNIWFSENLIGCSECIDCSNLDNKSYCINNIEYSKSDYFIKKKSILKEKNNYGKKYKELLLNNNYYNTGSDNISGSGNINCSNIKNGYFNYQIEKSKNTFLVGGKGLGENIYDSFTSTPPEHELYGTFSVGFSDNLYNCIHIIHSSNLFYCYYVTHCSYCIGCTGLTNKSYCIFNKQYTKVEWYKKADEIFSQMDEEGTLGDFFPGELNPFYFNDTVAGLIGGFTKEEVVAKGYMWRDDEIKVDIPEGSTVILTDEIDQYQWHDADGNWRINPDILKVVIKDEKGNCYRIVQMEYDLLIKHGLPIPAIHWMDRMKLNFGM